MPTILTAPARERDTYAITVAFTDDASASVAPNSGLVWSLFKKVAGVATIVNSRSSVAIASAASVTIVLSGADLVLVTGELTTRWVVIEGTYNSSLGTNLPLKDQVQFSITNLVGVV